MGWIKAEQVSNLSNWSLGSWNENGTESFVKFSTFWIKKLVCRNAVYSVLVYVVDLAQSHQLTN